MAAVVGIARQIVPKRQRDSACSLHSGPQVVEALHGVRQLALGRQQVLLHRQFLRLGGAGQVAIGYKVSGEHEQPAAGAPA